MKETILEKDTVTRKNSAPQKAFFIIYLLHALTTEMRRVIYYYYCSARAAQTILITYTLPLGNTTGRVSHLRGLFFSAFSAQNRHIWKNQLKSAQNSRFIALQFISDYQIVSQGLRGGKYNF